MSRSLALIWKARAKLDDDDDDDDDMLMSRFDAFTMVITGVVYIYISARMWCIHLQTLALIVFAHCDQRRCAKLFFLYTHTFSERSGRVM